MNPKAYSYPDAMRRLPLLWQIFVTYGLLVVPSLALFGSTVVAWVEEEMLRNVERELGATAALLQETVRGRNPAEEQPRLTALRDELGVRITLLAGDGRVLVDTDKDPDVMDNHAGRLEIEAARTSGTGTGQVTRYS